MENIMQHYISKDYHFNMSKYIQEAIDIFKKYPGGFIGFAAITFVASAILGSIPMLNLVSLLLLGPLYLGYFIVGKKIKDGLNYEFNDFFKGYEQFSKLALVFLLIPIFVFIGFICLIIPGIYLSVSYMFAAPLAYFKGLEFWDAMEISRKVITKQWWSFFGFVIVLALLNIAGAILLGVGLLISMPISSLAVYIAYDDIIEQQLS